MSDLAPALASIAFFAIVGWIVKTIVTSRRLTKIAEIQAEAQSKMLEKLGSAEEIKAYLESDAGRKFFDSDALEQERPYRRILGSIQAGLILALVGLAVFLMHGRMGAEQHEFAFLGSIALALGLGFLLSAGAAFLLSKSWGLINGR
jgi:hypothetical protein